MQSKRTDALFSFYRQNFASQPKFLFSSPGRAEIVGNHTDHNRGKVLCASLSCNILAFAAPRADGVVEIAAENFPPIRFSVNDLGSREREKGRSVSLARGVCAFLRQRGYALGGFTAATHSTVFRGAGVSSSAAFEVLVAEIVNELFCGGRLTPFEKAEAAHYAENVYFGKPCGLLDQCSVAYGGLNKLDFFSPAPAVERVPPPEGYELVLVNTGGSHSGLTAHYAAIPREMGEVAAALGKSSLCETDLSALEEALPRLRGKVSDRAILRAFHFFEENARVDEAARALKEGNTAEFLSCVRRSGESSLAYLQNCFVAGQTEEPLVLAHKMSARLLKEGGFRMMGGGFAGVLLAFCHRGTGAEYGNAMARVFGRENIYYAGLSDRGACRIG